MSMKIEAGLEMSQIREIYEICKAGNDTKYRNA